MQRVFLKLLLVLLLIAPIFSVSGSAMAGSSVSDSNIPGWNLTFDDEFNGTSLDKSHFQQYWGEIGASWWNGDAAISLENGLLRLKITQEDVYQNGKTYHYTAGGFNQTTAQTYGRWVVRARFPQGVGTQSYLSLWRTDFSWPPEIDFAEVVGTRPSENVFSQHYSDGSQNLWDGCKLGSQDPWVSCTPAQNEDFTNDFHEYTLIWEPGTLTWLVDGVQQFSTTQKFQDFPMIMAVGDLVGACDSFSGCPDWTVRFPTYLDIDYIRIYQKG